MNQYVIKINVDDKTIKRILNPANQDENIYIRLKDKDKNFYLLKNRKLTKKNFLEDGIALIVTIESTLKNIEKLFNTTDKNSVLYLILKNGAFEIKGKTLVRSQLQVKTLNDLLKIQES